MAYIALQLDYIDKDSYDVLVKQCFGIAKMIYTYMQKIAS